MGILETQNVYQLIGKINDGVVKVDDALSKSSKNPVQNKVIVQALEELESQIYSYTTVTLLDTTLTEEVSQIQISQYNGKSFNCNKYCILLEIPATVATTEIVNRVLRNTGNWQVINTRGADFYTTTDPTKNFLMYVSFSQNSNIYWESLSGAGAFSTSLGGGTWLDSYTKVNPYPMAVSASLFNPDGIPVISLTGSFPVNTKIQIWGNIKQ